MELTCLANTSEYALNNRNIPNSYVSIRKVKEHDVEEATSGDVIAPGQLQDSCFSQENGIRTPLSKTLASSGQFVQSLLAHGPFLHWGGYRPVGQSFAGLILSYGQKPQG